MFGLPLFRRDPRQRPPQPFSRQTLEKSSRLRGATVTESVCPYCAVGCGQLIYTRDGQVINIEGNPHSPINEGTLCPRGADSFQLAVNPHRVKHVLHRAPYSDHWEQVSLDWAMDRIAQLVKEARDEGFAEKSEDGQRLNAVRNIGTLSGATLDNEENYLIKKLFGGGLGVVAIENQARIGDSASVSGLGASFGRGAATTFQQDLANSDCILFMGSNMAEAHPVAFRWPMKAKEKGAKLVHVDPRFTRMSALCDVYVGIRDGTDIAFLGGIINYVLTHERWFKEYVSAYTNASTLVEEGFQDTEDLASLFSGYDPEKRRYDSAEGHWAYECSSGDAPSENGAEGDGHSNEAQKGEHGIHGYGLMGGATSHSKPRSEPTRAPGGQPPRDPTLQHPRCVMQILRRHFARYTPEAVADICGCTPEQMIQVAELLCANSGRERTSSIVYAVGWTQHSTGVQIIRAAGILQLLLGNIGRPGGGIMAMRGHANIQGSTDVPTLYDLLPGYLPQPAADEGHEDLQSYIEHEGLPTGYWANFSKFIVSLLKAWYGGAATKRNQFAFRWLPRLDGDYSQLPMFERMSRGEMKGLFLFGQNPGGGGPNAGLHRAGLRNLDWLVVLDWFETESAVFWKNDPKGPPPADIKTEVFFIPAAASPEKEGSLTNTQRLLQWHDKAIDPPGDCRSDAWFVYNLGKRLKKLYEGSTEPKDKPIQHLTWDYEPDEPRLLPDGRPSRIEGEPDVEKILVEINGRNLKRRDRRTGKPKPVSGFSELKDDGSTSCGCWIYSGVFPESGRNRARERKITDNPVQPEWGFAWPHNRRLMYNRASADPEGRPWSERKQYIWWNAEQKKWVGADEPDFEPDKPPDYRPGPDAAGMDAVAGDQPFIMKPDGVGWLFAPGAVTDGPLPAHYEPVESPAVAPLYRRPMHRLARPNPSPAGQSVGSYGALNSFFLLEDHPNEYNLPEEPPQPLYDQGRRYGWSLLTGLALTAAAALIFRQGKRHAP